MDGEEKVSNLSVENDLDKADAIQIYAILKGKYSHFIQESASVLITADEQQELAAKRMELVRYLVVCSGLPWTSTLPTGRRIQFCNIHPPH